LGFLRFALGWICNFLRRDVISCSNIQAVALWLFMLLLRVVLFRLFVVIAQFKFIQLLDDLIMREFLSLVLLLHEKLSQFGCMLFYAQNGSIVFDFACGFLSIFF
jgi:hypothetical protein